MLLVALVMVASAAGAACPDGIYRLTPVRSLRGSQVNTITLRNGIVTIGDLCPAAYTVVRATPDGGHIVRARWRSCGGVRRVRLLAVVPSGCSTVTGVIGAARPFVRRRFKGTRCDGIGCPAACRTNGECDPGDYCAAVPGDCSAPGRCAPKPDACTQQAAPVCGCNGITYGNECSAAAAGARVAHAGPCSARCGGIAGIPCPPRFRCDPDPGSCDVVDAQGTCVMSGGFLCLAIYIPVCGCDGKTYGNDCQRLLAGEPKAYDGECRP